MFSHTCYLVSIPRDTWENARRDCRDKGADLVIVNDYEEQVPSASCDLLLYNFHFSSDLLLSLDVKIVTFQTVSHNLQFFSVTLVRFSNHH